MSHRDDAAALLELLNTICEAIPGFGLGTKTELGALVRYASVSDQSILTVLGTTDGRPAIREAAGLDPGRAHDAMEFSTEYGMVADKLELMASGVRTAIIRQRAPVGKAVLAALAMAKVLKYDVKPVQKALAKKQRKQAKRKRAKKG